MNRTAAALREILGVQRSCPQCYSSKVKDLGNGRWACTNCNWSGTKEETEGGVQSPTTPAAPTPDIIRVLDALIKIPNAKKLSVDPALDEYTEMYNHGNLPGSKDKHISRLYDDLMGDVRNYDDSLIRETAENLKQELQKGGHV
jgi:ribosomal protein L37AE/L43A